MAERTVMITVRTDVPANWSEHDVMDVLRFHFMLGELNSIEVDVSACDVLDARLARRPIQPGDLVERIDHDLDPREVVAVGRDWLTLDLLGSESPRLPLDNYRTVVPADGVL